MTKAEQVTNIFMLMTKLCERKRKGWYDRNINRRRVERVADHIYGCQMLAYAMQSEFEYDVDIDKVILMLTIHEIAETITKDITPHDMPRSKKIELEKIVVKKICELIPNGDYIRDLFEEMEETDEQKKTKEAIFAFQLDHAECDLQARLYEQDGAFKDGFERYKFTEEWVSYDRNRFNFDENFDALLEYVTYNEMEVKPHSNNRYQNVISFYTATCSLKDKPRAGEIIWNVKKDQNESIAQHIYSVEILALAIFLTYGIKLDIKRSIALASIHELGEAKTGDISTLLKTEDDIDKEVKASQELLSILTNPSYLNSLLEEYYKQESIESTYTFYCDKLAADLNSKKIDQSGLVDINDQENNPLLDNPIVKKYLETGESFSTMWLKYGLEVYNYPSIFREISMYAIGNDLQDPITKELGQYVKTIIY